MYPAAFDYLVAHNIRDALDLLAEHGEEAKLVAGGQSLIPLMKLRLARPKILIDIRKLRNLKSITRKDGHLSIGALTTHSEIAESNVIEKQFSIIYDAAHLIANPQVRSLGTVGGALCHADPASDWGPVVLALNGRLKCAGPKGEREVLASKFFVDAYTTALQPGEILTEIILPEPPKGGGGAYLKLERRRGDFAVASVAVQISMDEAATCRDVAVGLGAAGTTSLRAAAVEDLLRGKQISEEVLRQASRCLGEIVDPMSDIRGSGDYRREVLKVLFQRAVPVAIGRSESTNT